MSKLSKNLASTHEPTREEALIALDQYITSNLNRLTEIELGKVWKGIWYAMWLCDGGENQNNLTEQLAKICNKNEYSVKNWIKINETFWMIVIREWQTLDKWRVDKYYLLLRKVLRFNFRYLNFKNWDRKVIVEFNKMIKKPINLKKNLAVAYHLCDIYLSELEEYSDSAPEFIIDVFKQVKNETNLKTLKGKIDEEVLNDERVKQWWGEEDEEEEEEEDDEEEWTGF